jgi:5-methylcytosine-specific restriction endonuclease McrA
MARSGPLSATARTAIPFQKPSKVRLKGDKLRRLAEDIWEREGGMCAICGAPVDRGAKPHHEPPKSHGGQDIPEHNILLCYECHYIRHFTGEGRIIQGKCVDYLRRHQ